MLGMLCRLGSACWDKKPLKNTHDGTGGSGSSWHPSGEHDVFHVYIGLEGVISIRVSECERYIHVHECGMRLQIILNVIKVMTELSFFMRRIFYK